MPSIKSTIIPFLLIGLASALITLAVLPLADTQWAEGIRTEFSAEHAEGVRDVSRIFMIVVPLLKVTVLMGVPALITFGVLHIAKPSRE